LKRKRPVSDWEKDGTQDVIKNANHLRAGSCRKKRAKIKRKKGMGGAAQIKQETSFKKWGKPRKNKRWDTT